MVNTSGIFLRLRAGRKIDTVRCRRLLARLVGRCRRMCSEPAALAPFGALFLSDDLPSLGERWSTSAVSPLPPS